MCSQKLPACHQKRIQNVSQTNALFKHAYAVIELRERFRDVRALTSCWLFLNFVDHFIRNAEIFDVISPDVTFWDLPKLITILSPSV